MKIITRFVLLCASAIFMEGCGFRVRHNLFHDLPHWAVFHTGNCHELTDNRVHHYMLETEDGVRSSYRLKEIKHVIARSGTL